MSNGQTGNERVFDIGLVMAGAISAGAYTAGVVDFLLQALDEWQRQKDAGTADCPPHAVRIKVLAGASAGGMTAAIAAAALGGRIDPVTEVPPPGTSNNPLYESWVRRIDIGALLGKDDLTGPDARLRSVLDSSELLTIADDAIKVTPSGEPRPYLADPLHVLLSVANLRGVPYSIDVVGEQTHGHGMSAHADFMRFAVARAGEVPKGTFHLDPTDYGHANWRHLRDSALASGAFPVGLQPRRLSRKASDYSERWWQVPLSRDDPAAARGQCYTYEHIEPAWPDTVDPAAYDYDFLCVDGGLMNNEPLEFARRILADWGRNPRAGGEAHRAVVMVDPFPNVAPFSTDYAVDDALPAVAKTMFGALKRDARFKPDELVLAQREDVYSRFMIAPVRRDENDQLSPFPISSGALGGFGGFLSEAFRRHDFQLGRRNCQRFLAEHFALPCKGPEKNPLFDGWSDTARQADRIEWQGQAYLPIIPLVGAARETVPAPPEWPQLTHGEMEVLRGQVSGRANAVIDRVLRDYDVGGLLGLGARFGWKWKRRKAVGKIMDMIREDLDKRGQLTAEAARPGAGSASGTPRPNGPMR